MGKQYITVEDVARFNGVSIRAVQRYLKEGMDINGVKSYQKLNEARTSPYLITPSKAYLNSLKSK